MKVMSDRVAPLLRFVEGYRTDSFPVEFLCQSASYVLSIQVDQRSDV